MQIKNDQHNNWDNNVYTTYTRVNKVITLIKV